jgi:O-antigen/teichoic acid export membrane protein
MIPVYFSKIVLPFFPSFASKIANNDFEYVNKMVLRLFKIIFRFSIFLSICVFLFNKDFVRIWIGLNNFGGDIVNFWLIFYMFISASFSGFGIIIYATKKFEKWTLFSLLEIIIVISISYIFYKIFNFSGLVAGFALGSVFTQIYVAHISLKQIGLNYKYLISEVYKFALIPNILSLFFAYFLYKNFTINTLTDLVLHVAIFVLMHFIFYDFILFLFFKKRDFI